MQENNVFLDTNILIYLFDTSDPKKHNAAKKLIADLQKTSRLYVSMQVINEFSYAITGKISNPVPLDKLESYYDLFEEILHIAPLTMGNARKAIQVKRKYGYSYWDSLIIASALNLECITLYSEDMQDGQTIEKHLAIKNPL